jgi:hypothetical protein
MDDITTKIKIGHIKTNQAVQRDMFIGYKLKLVWKHLDCESKWI